MSEAKLDRNSPEYRDANQRVAIVRHQIAVAIESCDWSDAGGSKGVWIVAALTAVLTEHLAHCPDPIMREQMIGIVEKIPDNVRQIISMMGKPVANSN